MKKSLFAIAAVTAFAGAAQAQSSVTVYGILDVGYASSSNRVANNSIPVTTGGDVAASTSNNTGVIKTNSAGISAGAQSTNRLGFRGTEALGGGLDAFFTIEMATAPNGNTGVFTAAGNSNRLTFVG